MTPSFPLPGVLTRRCAASLAVVLLLLSGCASTDQAALATKTLPETLNLLAAKHHVCGVAVAVIKDRKLDAVETATGCPPTSAPTPDSTFQAASLGKPVFAYAVLKLVAQGRMSLDAPVLSYLPQGYRHRFDPLADEQLSTSDLVTDPRLQAVTVRMVLNHTSGLPNWASGGPLSFKTAPGAQWGYSGEGYLLLQRAVEAVTGQPLDHFMAEQVFKPLAMDHSDYVWGPHVAPGFLPGVKKNGAPRTTRELTRPVAPFTLYTSAADYGKFLVAVLNDAPLLKMMTASPVQVETGLNLSWGLGWGIEQGQRDAYLWHWGNNPGYRAFVMASGQTGDGFVMLANSADGMALAEPIAQKVLSDEHKVFRFAMLGLDGGSVFCRAVRLCS